MAIQRVFDELAFDLIFGPHIARLAEIEEKAKKHTLVSDRQIVDAIIDCHGNLTEAATQLGISRAAIGKRLTEHMRAHIAEEVDHQPRTTT